jgi:hypothetical protein
MSLKGLLQRRVGQFSDKVVPQARISLNDARKRLSDLNGALANRAVPKSRRSVVSELTLRQKAEQAGQKVR